jgi:SagB-type dehydrogenase family enzyme
MSKRAAVLIFVVACVSLAATLDTVALPKPVTQGGKPLMQALNERRSAREFAPDALSPQVLSNLLWAGFGINRSDGRRTAPSANNRQTIEIYVLMADGAYLYDAPGNKLVPVVSGDLRALAGTQDFVKPAPVNLVYVSDYAKMSASAPENSKILYAGAETGFVSQNVYLYCASEGLATVVRASVDRDALSKALKLRPEEKITLAQTVGYPKH